MPPRACNPLKYHDCIYCGQPVSSREHVVPAALGGHHRVRMVCQDCNNRALSELDRELCSRSPLAVPAAQALGDKFPYWFWLLDPAMQNVCLEVRPATSLDDIRPWPQLIFEGKDTHFRSVLEEGHMEISFRKFCHYMLPAHAEHRRGQRNPRWIWEPVKMKPPGRYPPRVFARRTLSEFNHKMHFVCRYEVNEGLGDRGRRQVEKSLANWNPRFKESKVRAARGGKRVELALQFWPSIATRALVKLGLNLIILACAETRVEGPQFRRACDFVRNDEHQPDVSAGLLPRLAVSGLECPEGAHRFRLVHEGRWYLVCSFFGGSLGAVAAFPGSSRESWETCEVTMGISTPPYEIAKTESVLTLTPEPTSLLRRATWRAEELLQGIV